MTWYTLFVLLNKINKSFIIYVGNLEVTFQENKIDEVMISNTSNLGIFSRPDTTTGLDFEQAEKIFTQQISIGRYHQIIQLVFNDDYTWI